VSALDPVPPGTFFGIRHTTKLKCYWTPSGWDETQWASVLIQVFTPRMKSEFTLPPDGEWVTVTLENGTEHPTIHE
jgi:hypothetical protein